MHGLDVEGARQPLFAIVGGAADVLPGHMLGVQVALPLGGVLLLRLRRSVGQQHARRHRARRRAHIARVPRFVFPGHRASWCGCRSGPTRCANPVHSLGYDTGGAIAVVTIAPPVWFVVLSGHSLRGPIADSALLRPAPCLLRNIPSSSSAATRVPRSMRCWSSCAKPTASHRLPQVPARLARRPDGSDGHRPREPARRRAARPPWLERAERGVVTPRRCNARPPPAPGAARTVWPGSRRTPPPSAGGRRNRSCGR